MTDVLSCVVLFYLASAFRQPPPAQPQQTPTMAPVCADCDAVVGRVEVVTRGIYDPTARLALERAAAAAVERLQHPECQKVLTDFRDASGRTIRETLDALGETPRQYSRGSPSGNRSTHGARMTRGWRSPTGTSPWCSFAERGCGRPTVVIPPTSRRSWFTRCCTHSGLARTRPPVSRFRQQS